jgi:hypothetical protein
VSGESEPQITNGNGSSKWWFPIVSGIALLVVQAFWSLAYNSITATIAEDKKQLKEDIARVAESQKIMWQTMLTKEVFHEYANRIEGRLGVDKERLDKHAGEMLPKERFEGRANADNLVIERLTQRLDNLDKEIHGTYSPKDAIATLQSRLDRLETFAREGPGSSARGGK